ncbi:mitochondrial ribosome and complex I assembly factor AltMIEF1 [Drosophila bipectinata]|uniref:mitochondrial ribosome and complex I assembly factor AltMIEF1 n=1 Tax=Drosophila bipectinata TaxID=42026 RepID=UPI001C8AF456|nr:MIEF1 upstream open reading frame protein [Drosophila bipectinata]
MGCTDSPRAKQNPTVKMFQPSRQQVLRLYKHLIRYGNHLKLTDKNYFLGRVRYEFRDSRGLTNPTEIEFNYKRGETLLKKGRIL